MKPEGWDFKDSILAAFARMAWIAGFGLLTIKLTWVDKQTRVKREVIIEGAL